MESQPLTRWSRMTVVRAGSTSVEYTRLDESADVVQDPLAGLSLGTQPIDLSRFSRLCFWPVAVETGTKWLVRAEYGTHGWENHLLREQPATRLREELDRRVWINPEESGAAAAALDDAGSTSVA